MTVGIVNLCCLILNLIFALVMNRVAGDMVPYAGWEDYLFYMSWVWLDDGVCLADDSDLCPDQKCGGGISGGSASGQRCDRAAGVQYIKHVPYRRMAGIFDLSDHDQRTRTIYCGEGSVCICGGCGIFDFVYCADRDCIGEAGYIASVRQQKIKTARR